MARAPSQGGARACGRLCSRIRLPPRRSHQRFVSAGPNLRTERHALPWTRFVTWRRVMQGNVWRGVHDEGPSIRKVGYAGSAPLFHTAAPGRPPEVRSTAPALQSLVETTGAALAPLLTGIVALRISLGTAFLVLIAGGVSAVDPLLPDGAQERSR